MKRGTPTPRTYLFRDEFNLPAPDPLRWWINPWCERDRLMDATCFNPVNVFIESNQLHLRVSKGTKGRLFDGAQVNTFQRGQWPPAKVLAAVAPPVHLEARMKLPSGGGLWPAFWSQSVDPTFAEFDFSECRMFQPNFAGSHVHNVAEWDGGHDMGVDLSANFHTYWANYHPTYIESGCDAVPFGRVPISAAPRIGLILTNMIGVPGSWGGEGGPPTVLPTDLIVDYVRAWKI